MIVLIGGEKGGTGKTTVATNLAAMRARAGVDVLLVDTDSQGSAKFWVDTRERSGTKPFLPCQQQFGAGLASQVRDAARRYTDVIIDAGGRDSAELRGAMVVADLAVIPVQASQFDLWTLERMNELVTQAKIYNAGLQAKILISRAPTNPGVADARMAAELVSEFPAFELCSVAIKDRIIFRRAAMEGRCVVEMADPESDKSAWEITRLYKEVFE